MPQSPAFTRPYTKGLGPRTPSQVSRFPYFLGCPSRSRVAKQHLTITSTSCARLLQLQKLCHDLFITPEIAPSHLLLLQKPTNMNYLLLRKLHLGCLPFVRINRLGRALNNGKGFSKISKPTERNGAFHLQFDFP